MFHNTHAGVNVMSTFFDPALIDTFVNRVAFMQQGITYLLGTSGVAHTAVPHAATIYPNPATGMAFLHIDLSEPTTIQLGITDMFGRVHYNEQLQRTSGYAKLALPVQDLPPGMYTVQLRDVNGNYLYNGKLQKL
jgi:hypothetical protein